MKFTHLKTPLHKFVEKTNADRFFVGWSLTQFRALHNDMDEQGLAAFLACGVEQIRQLSMCRQPDSQDDRFQEQIRQIAQFSACNPNRLIQLMREVAAFTALQEINGNVRRGNNKSF